MAGGLAGAGRAVYRIAYAIFRFGRRGRAMDARAQHRRGLALLVAGAIAFSLGGFFARWVGLDTATMLFWRGLFAGSFVTLWVMAGRRTLHPFRGLGRPDLFVALCSAGGMIGFLGALAFTSVANVAVIFATAPLLTAAIAWASLGERPPAVTLAAGLAALAGVVVMAAGAGGADDRLGDLIALGMTLSIAVMNVLMRRHRHVSMLPAAAVSAFLVSLLVLPFAAPLAVGARALGRLALFGTAQSGLGLVLLAIGARHVSAAQNALIAALEAPLAPFWVWLAFGEIPTGATFAGGLIVIAAIFANLVLVAGGERETLPLAASEG